MTPIQRAISYCLSLSSFRTDDVVAISGGDAAGIASYLRIIAKDGTIVAAAEAGLWMPGGKRAVATWRHQAATTKTREGGNSAAYRRAREARLEAERGARERGNLTSQGGAEPCRKGQDETESIDMAATTTVNLTKAAEVTGYSQDTLRRYCDQGKIRFVRSPTGHRRILETELRRLTEAANG